MIKFGLRASLYHLFTGNNGLVSARKIVIPLTSIQSKGLESLKRPLHTSSNEDDDFAELDLPMEKGGGVIPKLKTEKPEPFMKISGTKKKSHGSSFKADSFPNVKDVSPKVGNSSLDLENYNDERSNCRTSSSVTIKNVPSIIDLLHLKEAISVFGKVSKASKRSVPNGLDCCDIEFKSVRSSRAALSIGSIAVKNFNLQICPLRSLETVTIRISNISSETADSAIHFTCKLCGPLEGLVKTKEDVVDALFSVEGEADTKSILNKDFYLGWKGQGVIRSELEPRVEGSFMFKLSDQLKGLRLNSTVMDECKWSAHLQGSESPSMTRTDNGNARDDLGLKISGHLADLKRELLHKDICAEDLEYLHHSLLHLQNHPQGRRYHSNIE